MSDQSDLFKSLRDRTLRSEGTAGVKNLARVCSSLGYQDFQHYGQFEPGSSYGDIFAFLEDNSGAIDAIFTWMVESGFFADKIKTDDDDDDDDDEFEDED